MTSETRQEVQGGLRDETAEPAEPSRRRLLGGVATGGAALVTGAVVGGIAGANAAAADDASTIVDVACLGETIRINSAQVLQGAAENLYGIPLDEGDNRGSSFSVEGLLFTEGTISAEAGFIPRVEDSIGSWICRGFFLTHLARPEPHMSTEQQFIFGGLEADGELGTEMLISSGIEGRNTEDWRARRAIIGGTGRYATARGTVVQQALSRNSTVFPWGRNALNFRMTFEIDV